jgi:hypothetical protein
MTRSVNGVLGPRSDSDGLRLLAASSGQVNGCSLKTKRTHDSFFNVYPAGIPRHFGSCGSGTKIACFEYACNLPIRRDQMPKMF